VKLITIVHSEVRCRTVHSRASSRWFSSAELACSGPINLNPTDVRHVSTWVLVTVFKPTNHAPAATELPVLQRARYTKYLNSGPRIQPGLTMNKGTMAGAATDSTEREIYT